MSTITETKKNTKRGLGRGLDALLADNSIEENESNGIRVIRIGDIEPNKKQARKHFNKEFMEELAQSISIHGLIQPIIVRRRSNGFYEIIAGERRWRASKMAGLTELPAIVMDVSDSDGAEISLIENLQRENLNPIEEASGYRDLIDGFGLTQEEAARKVGKSRSAIANILRILSLPQKVQDYVIAGSLTYGHARSLLPLCGKMESGQVELHAASVVNKGLSVRETERLVKSLLEFKADGGETNIISNSYYKELEAMASEGFGRRISIRRKQNGKGSISIDFGGSADLEALLKQLCGDDLFTAEN